MEQAIYSQDEENFYGIMSPKAETSCEYETKEQACLGSAVEPEVVWVNGMCCK